MRKGGIALTGYFTEPTVHHTDAGRDLLCLYFQSLETYWDISKDIFRTSNAWQEMTSPDRQQESPLWSRGEGGRLASPSQVTRLDRRCVTIKGRSCKWGSTLCLLQ